MKEVFTLVKRLSRTEKRYFTTATIRSGGESSAYYDLFQRLNVMEELDEAALKDHLGAAYYDTKDYLYDALLRAMRDYRRGSSRRAQMREKILDAQYLHELTLFAQAIDRLREAKKIALQLHDHLSILEINEELNKIIRQNPNQKGLAELTPLRQESEGHFTAFSEEFALLESVNQASRLLHEKIELTNPIRNEALRAEYQHILTAKDNPCTSKRAQLRFAQTQGLLARLLGDDDLCFRAFAEVFDHWRELPGLQQDDFFRYLNDLSFYSSMLVKKQNYPRVWELIHLMKAMKPPSFHDEINWYYRLINTWMLYALNTADEAVYADLEESVARGLKKYPFSTRAKLGLQFNLAIVFLFQQAYEKCIAQCTGLLQQIDLYTRNDLRLPTRMMLVLALVEVDPDQAENALRSANREIQRDDDAFSFAFEQVILQYLRQYLRAVPGEAKLVLEDLEYYVSELEHNSKVKGLNGINEIVLFWVRAHLWGMTIGEVIREQNQRRLSDQQG